MRTLIFATLAVLPLVACSKPVVTDIGQDRLKVQAHSVEEALTQARRGCGLYGRHAVMVNETCITVPCTLKEYLVACVPVVDRQN